jgi:hypothetical protein
LECKQKFKDQRPKKGHEKAKEPEKFKMLGGMPK